ncbi:hypothetical protein [Dyella silvatica]|uniref:hypothetical protein n=1 Tax=Dyella silvatica TaxID=2992128 RepID=UPI002259EEC8|nr:hypothetical protein [Dyella silvatica]
MPNLDDVLNSGTLLRAAHGHTGTGVGVSSPLPEPDPSAQQDNALKSIWHYQLDFMSNSAQLAHISNLSCRVRGMNFMNMPVCESIDWGPVSVSARGNTIEVPLTAPFLVLSEYLQSGHVPDSSAGFWQLEMNTDLSFQNVFCYDLGPAEASSPPAPVADNIYNSPGFMPDPAKPSMPVDAVCGTVCTINLPNLYIVVVVSLVCGKERNNFEPGGVLGAGRIYPLIQVMANQPLDNIVAEIKLKRPKSIPPGHSKMGKEDMLPPIGPEFFADINNSAMPPTTWDTTFSHYTVEPALGDYVMVDPAKAARTISGAVAKGKVNALTPWGPDTQSSQPFDIEKLAGQGEFDSLHLAPRMLAPAKVLSAYPNDPTLKEIAMAPFCVHDCMHTHVRWGNSFVTPKHVKGWDGFTPYQKAGAPLVPPNQKITFTLLSHSEFRYAAQIASNITAGMWQIVNHHGSAYALAVYPAGEAIKFGLPVLILKIYGETMFNDEDDTWAMFYWHLRYSRGANHTLERVQVMDLAKARG